MKDKSAHDQPVHRKRAGGGGGGTFSPFFLPNIIFMATASDAKKEGCSNMTFRNTQTSAEIVVQPPRYLLLVFPPRSWSDLNTGASPRQSAIVVSATENQHSVQPHTPHTTHHTLHTTHHTPRTTHSALHTVHCTQCTTQLSPCAPHDLEPVPDKQTNKHKQTTTNSLLITTSTPT